jgi:hypothetical protein
MNYRESSFARWSETDIYVAVPDNNPKLDQYSPERRQVQFTSDQINFFVENGTYGSNEYENLLKLFINGKLDNLQQISLNIGNVAAAGISDSDVFFLTPMIIYIIRHVLKFN